MYIPSYLSILTSHQVDKHALESNYRTYLCIAIRFGALLSIHQLANLRSITLILIVVLNTNVASARVRRAPIFEGWPSLSSCQISRCFGDGSMLDYPIYMLLGQV